MKLPTLDKENTGLTTMGLTGNVILVGVIFAGLNPWWLTLAIFLIVSAIGHEVGRK